MRITRIEKELYNKKKINIYSAIGKCDNNFNKELYDFLSSNKKMRLIELGCRFPNAMVLFHHRFEYESITGIELESEVKSVDNTYFAMDEMEKYGHWRSFFDIYESLFNADEDELRPKINNKKEFDLSIRDHVLFNTDIVDFLNDNDTKFDLIIVDNILHFFKTDEKLRSILTNIKNCQDDKGMTYIGIRNDYERKKYFNLEEFRTMLSQIFVDGTFIEVYDGEEWELAIYYNKIELLE